LRGRESHTRREEKKEYVQKLKHLVKRRMRKRSLRRTYKWDHLCMRASHDSGKHDTKTTGVEEEGSGGEKELD